MKLWRRQQRDVRPEAEAEAEAGATASDRRTPAWRCANCQRQEGPFIYFENGKHYCENCAGSVGGYLGVPVGGRRHDDTTHVPTPDE